MKTGKTSTFAIHLSQVFLDDLPMTAFDDFRVGAEFFWAGEMKRLDGPQDILRLEEAFGVEDLHQKAARKVSRKFGRLDPSKVDLGGEAARLRDSVVLTDGRRAYAASLIDGEASLMVFHDGVPAKDARLWVARVDRQCRPIKNKGGLVCFAAGTAIETPMGKRPVEELRPGDLVQTRDNGARPISWKGSQKLTGARLYATPHLRPIRVRAGALGVDQPDGDLLVSPDHRLLICSQAARLLFNESEVLARAGELAHLPGFGVDMACDEVTYVHLAFDTHEILTAAGMACESFDPASANLSTMRPSDRNALSKLFPDLELSPPPLARRVLRKSEAALLGHRLH